MDANEINAYLERAREILGERSPEEIDDDTAVVAQLSAGLDIRKAVAAANPGYPEEGLRPRAQDWGDLAAHYDYLREHQAILNRLGVKE